MTATDRRADAAAERARKARPGQRIRLQTIAQAERLRALMAGNKRNVRAAELARAESGAGGRR